MLDGPWWTTETKPKRPSVLPFIQGLEKLTGIFNVCYSNVYNIAGFKRALRDDLPHTREKRLFLHISAHWSGRKVASSDSFAGPNERPSLPDTGASPSTRTSKGS